MRCERRFDHADIVDLCLLDHQRAVLSEGGTVSLFEEESTVWICELNDSVEGSCADWFSLDILEDSLVALSREGAIISIQNGQAELVGEFEHGIMAAAFSTEVLLLVTKNEDGDNVLLGLTADWSVLAEVGLQENCADITLCWRPDATLCAVSGLLPDGQRQIWIYEGNTLDLKAQCRSEDGTQSVRNLQKPLAWAGPDCSLLLASVQHKGASKKQVVFMESNGLRHGEFLLRNNEVVQQILWNTASTLFALAFERRVQVWRRCNYHWYLVQEFQYEQRVIRVVFDDTLIVLLENSWREYTLYWHGTGHESLVVDGSTLHMTQLGQAIIPPPMSAATMECEHVINHVALSRDVGVLLLSNQTLRLFRRYGRFFRLEDVSLPVSDRLRGVIVVDPVNLVLAGIECGNGSEPDSLVLIKIQDGSHETTNIPLSDHILTMVPWSDDCSGALIITLSGDLLELYDDEVIPSPAEPLLEPCPWIAGIKEPSAGSRLVVGLSDRNRLYCHDLLLAEASSSFYLSLEHEFVCLVTAGSRCQLRFIALSELMHFDPLSGSDEFNLIGFEPRNVERGAKLVGVPPSKPMAILQMPRGNLEGVYPRALVIRHVVRLLEKNNYKAAFSLMRQQRVDLNFLMDLFPLKFLESGLEALVEQVVSVDDLNLFISSLQSRNVTNSRLPSWLIQSDSSTFDFTTKTNQVCVAMRTIMVELEKKGETPGGRAVNSGYYVLPILSTFAKQEPPQLEEALALIKARAEADATPQSSKPPLFTEAAQSSIRYLAFLAEYELLFHTALGMYDYGIARAVARNSQMDPKFYLPLLKRYKELPRYMGRFEVDMKLKRYELALRNLQLSKFRGEDGDNSFTKSMELIDEHGLHKTGLELFREESERNEILLSLGDKFMKDDQASNALSIYMSTNPMDKTRIKEAAQKCNNWRLFMELSIEDLTGSEVESQKHLLAHQVSQKLAATAQGLSNKRPILTEAARILLDYTSDISTAVSFLIQGELWDEAKRVCLLNNHAGSVKSVVEGAIAYAGAKIEELHEKSEDFCKANGRYGEVIKLRREAVASGEAEETAVDAVRDDSSLFSAASNASNFSMLSTASSSSTGSSASLSSVISVRSSSTFRMVGVETEDKHKSSFNKIGRKKEKKKRKRKQKAGRMKPGSAAELDSLVHTLKVSIVTEEQVGFITEAIVFLLQNAAVEHALNLYEAFTETRIKTLEATSNRVQRDTEQTAEEQRIRAREGGGHQPPIRLGVEAEIDSLGTTNFPESLHNLVGFYESLRIS